MKKRLFRGMILCLMLGVIGFLPAAAAEQTQFKFGGGTSGGPWFVGVGGAVQMFNEQLAGKFEFTYGASAGSVENIRRVATYEYDTGFVHSTQLWEAVNSAGLFKGRPKVTNVRLIARVSDLSHLWVALKASGIKSLHDLAGKKVNVGPPGSGGQINSMYILSALGLWDKVTAQNLTFDGGARALADRQIDATTGSGIPFTIPAITEISQTNDIMYIPMSKEDIGKITAQYPFYFPVTAPAGVVKGVDEPVGVMMYSAYWIVSDKMPDAAVKAMLEIVTQPDNKKQLTNVQRNWSEVNGDFSGVSKLGIPIQKAAAEFWKSQGVTLPEGMEIK